jgi:hypothetical protein
MQSNTNVQPISLAERRAARDLRTSTSSAQLTPAQRRAYRQLAIVALGLDLPTLTMNLRARRLQSMPVLSIVPPTDQAA